MVRERLEQEHLSSGGEPARPGRQADHADELSGGDHRCVDRRAPAGVATGAGAVDELSAALQRGAAQRSLPERDPLGMMMVAVLVAFAHDRGAAQGHPVLLGEEDGAPVDVVERHQPREQRSSGSRRTFRLPGWPGPAPGRRRSPAPAPSRTRRGGPGRPPARSAGRRSRCAGRRARPPAPGWRRRAWTSRCGCACAPSRATARGPALSGRRCRRRRGGRGSHARGPTEGRPARVASQARPR